MVLTSRAAENYRYETTVDRIGRNRIENDAVGEIATSGRKLQHISDDPASTIKVFRNRESLAHVDQFKKTIEFSRGFLSKTESTLSSIYDSLIRAKELSIQQSNSMYDVTDRKSVSTEMQQIMLHVTRLGNTKYDEKFIFGGFQTSQPPISPEGNYLGDDGQIFLQVDEDSFRPINVNGRNVFDVPAEEENTRPPLIGVLRNLYQSLTDDNRDLLHKSMDDLDKAMGTVLTSLTSLGARRNAIDDVFERVERNEVQLNQDTGNLENADLVKTAIDLKRAEGALQYTLQASSKMLGPSLIDFLK